MNYEHEVNNKPRPDLKTLLAAELLSKLTDAEKDIIIEQIKALLSHGE